MKSVLIALLGLVCTGCLAERCYPMRDGDLNKIADAKAGSQLTARPWLQQAHNQLKSRLPKGDPTAMLTEDMVEPSKRSADVYAHFRLDPSRLDSYVFNPRGVTCTARVNGPDCAPQQATKPWEGYEEVWIPVREGLSLHGELGMARGNGQPLDARCIVVVPGLLGDNDCQQLRDLADALRGAGMHVLALEFCGHGQTHERYPEVAYDYGMLEAMDLLAVSEWLEERPHVQETGLIGYCWGANVSLLAAWSDGRGISHPSISKKLALHLRPLSKKTHYEAGIIALSPVLRFERIIESLETVHSGWQQPIMASLQEKITNRMKFMGSTKPSGSLAALINFELERSELDYANAYPDGLDFLRLMPHRGLQDGDKLAECRMPILMVQAANDPLSPAQDIADLFSRYDNPNLAGIILPSGGHVGFLEYARSYYYSLIVNFFDPRTAPCVK